MARWAQRTMQREQVKLFSPNLDGMIPDDHPVRLFDEILSVCDWAPWENHYCQVHGQPPIHPRVIAGVILYGLSRQIRSSRILEYMLASNIDFMWLAEGRKIDHSTICGFRTKFRSELKQLFKQVFRIAMNADLAKLETIALDATQVKANSSRHNTATAETIKERLARLDQMIERMLTEAEEADAEDPGLYGPIPTDKLPKDLVDAEQRRERLVKALAAAKARDESPKAKAKIRKGKKVKPAAVPIADPESKVLPNKEGGFAPNYTPIVTAEAHGGFIADAEVLPGGEDSYQAIETVDRIEETFGQKPKEILADSAYGSGQTLAALDDRNVEAFIPAKQRPDTAGNPAVRDDPTQPVAECDWDKLPRNCKSHKLDRAAFVYDEQADCYRCPMGRTLPFWRHHTRTASSGPVKSRVYQCPGSADCPLADQCVASKTGRRSVAHDDSEHHRRAMDSRLASERGRKIYAQRKWIAETPFGIIKTSMGLRQFLLRGLEKVKIEWLWTCTAFNLAKLVRNGAAVRAHLATIKG
jgi:transposase